MAPREAHFPLLFPSPLLWPMMRGEKKGVVVRSSIVKKEGDLRRLADDSRVQQQKAHLVLHKNCRHRRGSPPLPSAFSPFKCPQGQWWPIIWPLQWRTAAAAAFPLPLFHFFHSSQYPLKLPPVSLPLFLFSATSPSSSSSIPLGHFAASVCFF